jgi:hypothetical protein
MAVETVDRLGIAERQQPAGRVHGDGAAAGTGAKKIALQREFIDRVSCRRLLRQRHDGGVDQHEGSFLGDFDENKLVVTELQAADSVSVEGKDRTQMRSDLREPAIHLFPRRLRGSHCRASESKSPSEDRGV